MVVSDTPAIGLPPVTLKPKQSIAAYVGKTFRTSTALREETVRDLLLSGLAGQVRLLPSSHRSSLDLRSFTQHPMNRANSDDQPCQDLNRSYVKEKFSARFAKTSLVWAIYAG
jgi:hypothetical protein